MWNFESEANPAFRFFYIKIEKENFWLHNLTNNLTTAEQANKLIKQYQPYKDDNLHQSIMNLIVNANYSLFKEEYTMCEALMELMKDEFAVHEARGQNLKLLEQIKKKLAKGNTPEEIADILEEDIETILSLMQEL